MAIAKKGGVTLAIIRPLKNYSREVLNIDDVTDKLIRKLVI